MNSQDNEETEKTEEWKSMDVLGFSNYMASEIGRVFNISTNKILEGCFRYETITYNLTNDDGQKQAVKANVIASQLFTNYVKGTLEVLRKEDLALKLPKENKDDYDWLPIPKHERYKICKEGKILSINGEIMKNLI